MDSRGVDLERIVKINGKVPFKGADQLIFSRLWTDEGTPKQDNQGNDIRPSQKEIFDWQTVFFHDSLGYVTDPYLFYFNQGDNTISLEAVSEPVIIGELKLVPKTQLMSYEEYNKQNEGKENHAPAGFETSVQGENAMLRSSPSLYPRYDRSSPGTVPYSVNAIKLNYIGGDPWRTAGQWIQWEFEVPEDGFYNITVKGRQNYARGCISSRAFTLDGETPFAESQVLEFSYENNWTYKTIADESGTPFRFWLTKGTHTVRLEATLGSMG